MSILKTSIMIADTDFMKYWSPTNTADPHKTTTKSNKKYLWVCSCCGKDYERQANVFTTARTTYCRECRYIHAHDNRIKTTPFVSESERLMQEWDWEGNADIDPSDIRQDCGTRKVKWICKDCGHHWTTTPGLRRRTDCPKCRNAKAYKTITLRDIKLQGSLAETHSYIATEWHPTKNGTLTPNDITAHYGKKVWFQCEFGHEYRQPVNVKTRLNRLCPKCTEELHTSFPEQTICFYLEQVTEAESRKKINGYEIDIYLPKFNAAIEYNGLLYHKTYDRSKYDKEKETDCIESGLTFLRIYEAGEDTDDGNALSVNERRTINYQRIIDWICDKLYLPHIDTDIKRDTIAIKNRFATLRKQNSLLTTFPDIAALWDYSSNGIIRPEHVSAFHNGNFYFLCSECGKAMYRKVSNMHTTTRCNECAKKVSIAERKKSIVKRNGSFAECYPKLLEEWDTENNAPINLHETPRNYNYEAYWICKVCGFHWHTQLRYRARGAGCPACTHQLTQYYKRYPDEQPDNYVPIMIQREKNKKRGKKR